MFKMVGGKASINFRLSANFKRGGNDLLDNTKKMGKVHDKYFLIINSLGYTMAKMLESRPTFLDTVMEWFLRMKTILQAISSTNFWSLISTTI